jgi:hypothetical protein
MNNEQNNTTPETAKFGVTPNIPNPVKLLESLRHLDYDNISAICDLIDNSIDADAGNIWININPGAKNEVSKIVIIDDGIGMDYRILNEALKLGSETNRNAAYDLGLYGMGLITASLSLGTKLSIITKAEKSDAFLAVHDLEDMHEHNSFVKIINKLTTEELVKSISDVMNVSLSDDKYGLKNFKSFTLVSISNIDRSQWARASALADNLKRRLGQVFRKFIQANRCNIFVDGVKVNPFDPIHDFEPTVLTDESIKLDQGDIRIIVTELKDYGTEINKDKSINIPNQGFYVLRNNREIAAGESFGIFSKHNDLNLLRIEFSYPGNLDGILNTTFSKQRIRLDQSIEDKVSKICNPFIRQVRNRAKIKQSLSRENKEDFSEVEKFITHKSHLLKNPKIEVEQRKTRNQESDQQRKEPEMEKTRLNITKRHRLDIESLKVRFEQIKNGEKAPLWEADQERDKIIVRWNIDHPFYQTVVSPNADNPEVFNPMAYLIFCFANAELIAKDNSDSQEILDNIRWDVGRNLAILLR